METKPNDPKITQNQIAQQRGYLDFTNKRYRDEENMSTPYNRRSKRKNMSSQDSSTT